MRFTKPKNLCGILNSDLHPLVPDKGTKSQLTQCYQTVTDNSQCLLFVFSNCLVGWNVTRPNLVYFNEKRIFIEIILPDIFCLTGDMPELYQGSMGYIFFLSQDHDFEQDFLQVLIKHCFLIDTIFLYLAYNVTILSPVHEQSLATPTS